MTELRSAVPRLMIAAANSGAGKTSVVCALLRALSRRGKKVAAFKCGPDYIDPMFHSRILGAESTNLDIFMCGEEGVRFLLCKNAAGADLALMEGVMGLYDGLEFSTDYASSNHLSMLTETPLVLVVNVKGMSLSAAALLRGFRDFRENRIRGVLLNNCTAMSYPLYKELIESQLGLTVYGYLPHLTGAELGSRHLGLITAAEVEDLHERVDLLADAAEQSVDVDGLLALAASAPALTAEDLWAGVTRAEPLRLALASDKAFCFFYKDFFRLLERMGAELVPFSPLSDPALPEKADGLLLFGGYPEEFPAALAENAPMRSAIRAAVQGGLPTYAECGGFMYLLETLRDRAGNAWPMAGALPGGSEMKGKLVRFGYNTLTSKGDNLLFPAGGTIRAHEFHYSDSDNNGADLRAEKKNRGWDCIHASDTLFAGYPHLNLSVRPDCAARFLAACAKYHKQRSENDG